MTEIKLMVSVQDLLNVRDSIVERKHIKLMYVEKPVTRAHTSLGTRIYKCGWEYMKQNVFFFFF